MRPEINHDAHIRVGTCGSCGGPVVIYTGPWRSRERVCRHCGVAPATPHIDKCQCPEHAPLQYRRTACEGAVKERESRTAIRIALTTINRIVETLAAMTAERDALRESLGASLLRESQEQAWRLALESRAEKAEGERDVSEAVVDSLAQQWAALKVWLRDPENRSEYPEWADGVLDQMEHPEDQ